MRALVIGGMGPSGPFIVNGLAQRGHTVAILNRGTHDCAEVPRSVERIIGDPHFKETLIEALGGRTFDLVIATYGRLLHIASVMAGRTQRLISLGGPAVYSGLFNGGLFPAGQQVPLTEDAPKIDREAMFPMGRLAVQSEEALMAHHAAGDYQATHLRYPVLYGPRQLAACEWWVIRRILHGRPYIILPDSGLSLVSRGYAENMAEAVLLAVDNSVTATGKIYNCADSLQFSLAQWVEVIANSMDASLEVISVPGPLAYSARNLMIDRPHSNHLLLDTHKIRSELGYRDKVCPVDALRSTVEWYQANPVTETPEQKKQMEIHYRTEDDMARICRETYSKLAAIEHFEQPFTHPYPHPRRPRLARDHQGR